MRPIPETAANRGACRRIIRVDKTLSDNAMAGDDFQISISYALWAQWGEIAVEREGTARAARAEWSHSIGMARSLHRRC